MKLPGSHSLCDMITTNLLSCYYGIGDALGGHTHTHTHTSSQEVRSGKFEMYDYGSAEDNMKYYGVVSECVLGGWWRVQVCGGGW